jgi:hypothetical protein
MSQKTAPRSRRARARTCACHQQQIRADLGAARPEHTARLPECRAHLVDLPTTGTGRMTCAFLAQSLSAAAVATCIVQPLPTPPRHASLFATCAFLLPAQLERGERTRESAVFDQFLSWEPVSRPSKRWCLLLDACVFFPCGACEGWMGTLFILTPCVRPRQIRLHPADTMNRVVAQRLLQVRRRRRRGGARLTHRALVH